MSIKSNIFIWFFVATVLPLTALALSAIYYSEYNYEKTVSHDINNSINRLATDLLHYHEHNRELVLGLANSPAVKEILPVLYSAKRNKVHPDINVRRSRLNRFFEGFQTILQGVFYLRILDSKGNSLIKVSNVKRSAAIYDNLLGIPFVESGIQSKSFRKLLSAMPENEVSMLSLPHNKTSLTELTVRPLLDYIVPLYHRKRQVGALTVTLFGTQLDSLLDHAPRLYKGKLVLFENNPDSDTRNGMLLYDDLTNIRFSQQYREEKLLKDIYNTQIHSNLVSKPDGKIVLNDKSILYFTELFPYPNQLTSWVLATKVEHNTITEPFKNIKYGIWIFVGVALFISILLANIAAHKVSNPVKTLAKNLTAFADGNSDYRAPTNYDFDEINSLSIAYNYLADNLDSAQQDRDTAQSMVLRSAKLASIGQMAAGIGHEINNPLNNILSYSKLLLRDNGDNDNLKKDINSLRDEALRASNIIKGILNFARQVPPRYESFQVTPFIQESLQLVQQTSKNKNISIRILDNNNIIAQGDRSQLQQVLINLLINAIQASTQNGQIVVGVKDSDNCLIISIRDEGSGIKPETLDKIFDPFFSTKSEGQGSGLGLSISLGIMESHQGKLFISNNQDQGVTATMKIPLNILSKKS
ncbi:histidine protein kinase [hydrothermal vent metagenome]|uniref:histidine kinase n=1 Tax=hydrothermal vent metagenome TaxID=652676 RepID=A0A3B0ZMW1_9ZZZZ